MSIEVSLTPDGIGAVYTSSDVLTGQDLLDADARLSVEIASHPELRYLLVDHSAIPDEKVDTASLRVLADRTSDHLELLSEGLVAIIAPTDILFGLSRMWEAFAEQPGLTTRVIRTRDEATEWLGAELAKRQLPFKLPG